MKLTKEQAQKIGKYIDLKVQSEVRKFYQVKADVFEEIKSSPLFQKINDTLYKQGQFYLNLDKSRKEGKRYILPLDMTKLDSSTQDIGQYSILIQKLAKAAQELKSEGIDLRYSPNEGFCLKVMEQDMQSMARRERPVL